MSVTFMPTPSRSVEVPDEDVPPRWRRTRLTRADGLLLAGALIVTGLGATLVATAPFDGAARNTLGAGLLTGVIVGFAIVALERRLEGRRLEQEAELAEGHRRSYSLSARTSLMSLVGSHAELMWTVLTSEPNDWDERSLPPGWRGPADRDEVTRALVWVAELARADPTWSDAARTRARVDAVLFVATDLAARFAIELDERDGSSLEEAHVRTIRRLTAAADRLSELGDPVEAKRLDDQADALASGETPSYKPQLSGWATEHYDDIIDVGDFHAIRSVTSWLIDQLRPDALAVDSDGEPIRRPAPNAASYRWSPLFVNEPEYDSAAWDERFAEASWFRSEVLDVAAREVPAMFGLEPEDAR